MNKILISYFLSILINFFHSSNLENEWFIYLYPYKKIKMKNVCAILEKKKYIAGSVTITQGYLYIKNKCGKNEKCVETEEGYFQCARKLKQRKIGENCGINEECYSGQCYNGKCGTIENDMDCTELYDINNPEMPCNPGYWCYKYDSINTLYKCVKYLEEGEDYDISQGKICRVGLSPMNDNNNVKKCFTNGMLDDGKITENSNLCKSGYSAEDFTKDQNLRCFSVIKDSSCGIIEGDGESYCSPEVNGLLESEIITLKTKCTNKYNDKYLCPFTISKSFLFQNYTSKLNSMNFQKIYSDEYKFHGGLGFGDNKLSQAYLKYYDYDYLRSFGILNEDGSLNKDKKDIWEFYWKRNNSNYIYFNLINIFILLLIIF